MTCMRGHGCGHPSHQRHGGVADHSMGCCHSGQGFRRFPSREEQISHLEEYLKALQEETKGVQEYIAELKKK